MQDVAHVYPDARWRDITEDGYYNDFVGPKDSDACESVRYMAEYWIEKDAEDAQDLEVLK